MTKKNITPAFDLQDAMPLANFTDQAYDAGWNFFEQSFDQKPDPLDLDLQSIALIAAEKFSDDAGRRLLDYLCDQTLRRPVVLSGLGIDPMQAYAHGCQREGQNNLMFLILKLIATGRNETHPTREAI